MERHDRHDLDEGSPQMSHAWRRRARRAMLRALAGGGLTAIGLGGPLTSAALGSASTAATGSEDTPPPATGTTTTGSTTTTPPTQSSESSSSSTTTATTTSTTSQATSSAPPPVSTAPASTTPAPAGAPAPNTGASAPATQPAAKTPTPTVVVQSQQQQPALPPRRRGSKAGSTHGGPSKPTAKSNAKAGKGKNGNTPASVPPGTPNGVAAPPQTLAGATEGLSALLGQSAVSAQALAFYRIPLFLLPIYQAAAVQYGVPWQILAAINEVETDYGSDQSVSSAGAVGWMQFMPETWMQYGVDALNAGYADPYNPVDAIFAAARYLRAAGAAGNLRQAILAYNHSEAYAESVLLRAKLIATYPQSVIATLTGLTEGSLPVAHASVSDYLSISAPAGAPANATAGALPLAPTPSAVGKTAKAKPAGETLRFVDLLGPVGAPVTAVEDGRVVKLGHSHRLGNYLALQDVYGDIFTYAGLGSIAPHYHPAASAIPTKRGEPGVPLAPIAGAPQTAQTSSHAAQHAVSQLPLTLKVKLPTRHLSTVPAQPTPAEAAASAEEAPSPPAGMGRKPLFAAPRNPVARVASARRSAAQHVGGGRGERWLPLRVGSVVAQGTVLGHLSAPKSASPAGGAFATSAVAARLGAGASGAQPSARLRFAIKPAGDGTTIDPRAIIANWRQLDTALHPKGAKGTFDLLGATVAQVFQMSQSELERTVLSDPGIALSSCGRRDVAAGAIDGRVLATLAFLSRVGLKPTVGGLGCGLHAPAAQGAVASAVLAAHDGGVAVDITAINGVQIAGHQGVGTVTDVAIRALLTLTGRFAPHQIVSLMSYPGSPSTQASADRYGEIHIAFRPIAAVAAANGSSAFTTKAHSAGPGQTAPSPLASAGGEQTPGSLTLNTGLNASQWDHLITRIGALPQPKVANKPTTSAIHDPQAAPGNRDLGAGAQPAEGEGK